MPPTILRMVDSVLSFISIPRVDTSGLRPDQLLAGFVLYWNCELTAKVKLSTTVETSVALGETLHTANACCDWISARAWKARTFGQFALNKLTYTGARDKFGLSAQVVVRCIDKVCDAYKLDKKVKRTFWADGALPFDDRILTWNTGKQVISIWTTKGRLRIPFEAGPRQTELLSSRAGRVRSDSPQGIVLPGRDVQCGRAGIRRCRRLSRRRPWRCRDCRYQRRKEVQWRGHQGREASPPPPARQTAKEADPRRKAQTAGTVGQGGPVCHTLTTMSLTRYSGVYGEGKVLDASRGRNPEERVSNDA